MIRIDEPADETLSAPLQDIRNVVEVLEVARELGYLVRGIKLLEALRDA